MGPRRIVRAGTPRVVPTPREMGSRGASVTQPLCGTLSMGCALKVSRIGTQPF